jgi:hypothetical protein
MLDCQTPKGQQAIGAVERMVAKLGALNGTTFRPTDPTSPYDFWIIKDGHVIGICECKARQMDVTKLKLFGSYLITEEKLSWGVRAAKRLGVPFYVIVFLSLDENIVWWCICDPAGELKTRFTVEVTRTQATVNGGEAWRPNAYLSLADMQLWKPVDAIAASA